MKKLWFISVLVLLLTGCNSAQQYERQEGACCVDEIAEPGLICITATDAMAAPVMSTENSDRLYVSEDYVVTLQTVPGGNLDGTLRSCTGFGQDRLTVVETEKDGMKRYDCAWTAAGEGTQTVGRTTVLDDGYYHYVLTVSAPGSNSAVMTAAWQQLAESFKVSIAQ